MSDEIFAPATPSAGPLHTMQARLLQTRRKKMTTIFDDTPKYPGLHGDMARVTYIEDRVLIRAIDAMAEEAVTIAMTPDQARSLAAGIVAAAENAEAHQ